jgi:hypothetical protein
LTKNHRVWRSSLILAGRHGNELLEAPLKVRLVGESGGQSDIRY